MTGLEPLALALVVVGTLVAPVGVGLLIGADRKMTAAVQLRIGPPLLQPLYDLTKLLAKASPAPDRLMGALVAAHLVLAAGAFSIVLAGGDLLVAVLVLGAAQVLFILAAASVESPYAQLGASRELVVLVATEPLLILVVIAYAVAAGTFSAAAIAGGSVLVLTLPTLGVTLAVLLAATLRKSPFDIASSHHAHQELVKGSTTEMAGRWLALAELGHWYETALVLVLIVLAVGRLPVVALILVGVTYAAVVIADNSLPRATWRMALAVAWGLGGIAAIIALVTAGALSGGIVW
jgi:formate hydrogenlyase subunit 4